MISKRTAPIALALFCCIGTALAQPTAAFGPQTFEVERAAAYLLFVRNGDGEMSRVDGATVTINGFEVVRAGDLTADKAGSFLTLAIGRPGEPPVFVHGRLVLPWGRNDDERTLTLALKNGSHRFPRAVR